MRVKLMKGVYIRGGKMGVQKVSEDVMKEIDSGIIYLTSKRIIFMGNRGNKIIHLKKILDFNVFKNGIHIQKDAGKPPFLEFKDDIDSFTVILSKALQNI